MQGRAEEQPTYDLVPSHCAQQLIHGIPESVHPRKGDEGVVSPLRQVQVGIDYFLQVSPA
jgi:hypothetical protein